MTDEKFTPGPWRVAGEASGYIVYAGTDPEIGSVQIATVGAYRDKELLPFNRERWDADCRLMAAAPDLFAALKAMVDAEIEALREWAETGGPAWDDTHPAYRRYSDAVAALAKVGVAPKQDRSPEDV